MAHLLVGLSFILLILIQGSDENLHFAATVIFMVLQRCITGAVSFVLSDRFDQRRRLLQQSVETGVAGIDAWDCAVIPLRRAHHPLKDFIDHLDDRPFTAPVEAHILRLHAQILPRPAKDRHVGPLKGIDRLFLVPDDEEVRPVFGRRLLNNAPLKIVGILKLVHHKITCL